MDRTDYQILNILQADSRCTLRRMGVIDALRKAGAGEGDTVQIEDMQFDFVD